MPSHRPTSRTSSTYTSSDGMAPSSMTSGTSRTSRTSITSWMDEKTARQAQEDEETEELLIDMSDDAVQPGTPPPAQEPSPAEKLKILLRQMDAEIRDSTSVPRPSEQFSRSASGSDAGPSRSSWREGRRGDFEPRDMDQEDSPPTPPRRFAAARNAQPPPVRIPTRAAVLRASTSRSPEPSHAPTPLEAFIARPSTSSTSLDRSTSSSSSRKGKERARFVDPAPISNTSPRMRSFDKSASQDVSGSKRIPSITTPSRPRTASGRTPRRWSVELAPDGEEFAQNAHDLEVRGDVELDLEEETGDPPWESESSAEDREYRQSGREERTIRASPQPARTRPHLSPGRTSDGDTSLPALPQPSGTDTEEEGQSFSSRRAGMFRSPKSRVANRFASMSLSHDSTSPGKQRRDTTMASVGATPHPPGRWSTPSKPVTSHLTSSNLARPEEEASVHRIKLSPARQSPRSDPDTSFLGKLGLRSQNHPPKPSQTLAQAQETLHQASAASSAARLRVEATQRQWLDALATAQRMGDGAVLVARKGLGWGNWAWWVGVEILLVWGVFRVTLDYAQSTAFLTSLDPFSPILSPAHSFALSVPLPSAVSAFVIPRRGSANLFDLLERAGMWSRLEGWGLDGNASGLKLIGGVPT